MINLELMRHVFFDVLRPKFCIQSLVLSKFLNEDISWYINYISFNNDITNFYDDIIKINSKNEIIYEQ